jgi:beta-galactosidase
MNSPLSSSNTIWPRSVVRPLPLTTAGVQQPILLLDGVWKMHPRPPAEFWTSKINPASWNDVPVPGHTGTQGYHIEGDQEYAFRRTIHIPADFSGKRVIIRFEGVNCFARVWVDGAYVMSHYGGFTSWDCDITAFVQPGHSAGLTVGVAHKPNEISPMNEGGMIRSVKLVALPPTPLARLHVETDFDAAYADATLKVTAGVEFEHGANSAYGANSAPQRARVLLALVDPQGKAVPITPNAIDLDDQHPADAQHPAVTISIPVAHPLKWDAEHPNLYVLQVSLLVGDEEVETVLKNVGFRKIVRDGNRLLVNGEEVKLRGVCRHDIYPLTGRAVTPALVEQDVLLFRAANVNFIRTSHYPPREDFLDACDRYGMYVEDEISVAFVYQFIRPTENDPDLTEAYMGQFSEMIERDRSHPSVIMWSLANESYWGRNFQKQLEYARQEDPTRPTIFSYPITIPNGHPGVDIWSLHYASWNANPADRQDNFSVGMAWNHSLPVLHDEYAHLPCYDHPELRRDPGVHDFWGESVKRFWESIYTTPGALGGALWAGIDEISITPQGYRGWEWGIYDGWRRHKPEYWLTQKAYSPIRVDEQPLPNPGAGRSLALSVRNWFSHTNLNEIKVRWQVGTQAGSLPGPDAAPGQTGILTIPARQWADGDVLNLQFYRLGDILVDEYNLPVGAVDHQPATPHGPAPEIHEDAGTLTLARPAFSLVFSKKTGLIEKGTSNGVEVITGGPYLNLVGVPLAEWSLRSFACHAQPDEVVVEISGSYGALEVRFTLRVDGTGLIRTTYTIDKMPFGAPRARKLNVGEDVGGFSEVGVAFLVSGAVDRLAWERKGLWSAYPAGHIGRTSGTACKARLGGEELPGSQPDWPWGEDERNYLLFGRYDAGGRGTKDFSSTKANIYRASAVVRGTQAGLRAESNGQDAVRLEILKHPRVTFDDRHPAVKLVGTWLAVDGELQHHSGTETISNKPGDYAEFTFQGTGVAWIGAKDLIYGTADVYLDGALQASGIDLYSAIGLGTSRGEEKIYQQFLFSKEGLPDGEHTLRIVVTGKKNPLASNAYVSIDAFWVLGSPLEGDIRMNINNAWNYPELTWGNYVKEPIIIEEGYTNSVQVRLAAEE